MAKIPAPKQRGFRGKKGKKADSKSKKAGKIIIKAKKTNK